MAPHLATKPLKDIAAARSPGQTQWLQLYVEMDRKASEKTSSFAFTLTDCGVETSLSPFNPFFGLDFHLNFLFFGQ